LLLLLFSNTYSTRGAISINFAGGFSVNSCNFNNCISTTYGGAIRNMDSTELTLDNNTFSNCGANEEGGAIYFTGTGNLEINGTNMIENCYTINDDSKGGAISLLYRKFFIRIFVLTEFHL
jgi:hypothetical protein